MRVDGAGWRVLGRCGLMVRVVAVVAVVGGLEGLREPADYAEDARSSPSSTHGLGAFARTLWARLLGAPAEGAFWSHPWARRWSCA